MRHILNLLDSIDRFFARCAAWLEGKPRQPVTEAVSVPVEPEPELPLLNLEVPPWSAFEAWRLETELSMPSPYDDIRDSLELGAGDA